MHATVAFLSAAALFGVCLSGQAAEAPYTSHSRLDQPGRAFDEDSMLRESGTARPGRAADAEMPLKSRGTWHESGRMADEGVLLKFKSAGNPSKPRRAADSESTLKPSGTAQTPNRMASDDDSLKPAGSASRAGGGVAYAPTAVKAPANSNGRGRTADEFEPMTSAGVAARPARAAHEHL